MRRSCFFGRYDSALVKCTRPGSSCDGRSSVVGRRTQFRIGSCRLQMLSLSTYWRDVSLALRSLLFMRRTCIDPAVTAVVADAVHGSVVDHGRVVNIVNVGDVHVVHRTVVEKPIVVPTPAFISIAEIAEAVVDPAIEPDSPAPIALMEQKSVAAPTPISWGPEVTLGRAKGLFIHRQGGGADPDRYADLRKRCCRHGEHDKRE